LKKAENRIVGGAGDKIADVGYVVPVRAKADTDGTGDVGVKKELQKRSGGQFLFIGQKGGEHHARPHVVPGERGEFAANLIGVNPQGQGLQNGEDGNARPFHARLAMVNVRPNHDVIIKKNFIHGAIVTSNPPDSQRTRGGWGDIASFEAFYREAYSRDRAMAENVIHMEAFKWWQRKKSLSEDIWRRNYRERNELVTQFEGELGRNYYNGKRAGGHLFSLGARENPQDAWWKETLAFGLLGAAA
jgi:hypothetical protein